MGVGAVGSLGGMVAPLHAPPTRAPAPRTRPTPTAAPSPPAGAPRAEGRAAASDLNALPIGEGTRRQLDLALTDLTEVFGVYPFRPGMPACGHCVSDDDLRILSMAPARIPRPDLDRYVAKSLTTWGEAVDLKRLLPEILTRLCDGHLSAPDALVGARLRRAEWLDWPAAETPAVRRTLRAAWLTTLAAAPAEGRAPVTHRLSLLASAEDDLAPYLDLWEDRLESPGNPNARLAAVLHVADLLAPVASGGRRRLTRGFPLARRGVVAQLEHWLRQPVVIQRLAHAADALEGTRHGEVVGQARLGLARLRNAG